MPIQILGADYEYYYYKIVGPTTFRHSFTTEQYFWSQLKYKMPIPIEEIDTLRYKANDNDIEINITLPDFPPYNYSLTPADNIGYAIGILVTHYGELGVYIDSRINYTTQAEL